MLQDNEILAALMKKAAQGNESAFSDLVKLYEKPVFNIAMQTVKNHEDALDVSQEVFLKLWRTSASYRGDCSVNSWVIKIARNTALDLLRRRASHLTDSLTVEDEDGETVERDIPVSGGDDDPVASYERSERINMVRNAIGMLGSEHREIIILRDISGLSYAEIAEILGIEEGTVKSRLNRARNSLKEILQSRNIF